MITQEYPRIPKNCPRIPKNYPRILNNYPKIPKNYPRIPKINPEIPIHFRSWAQVEQALLVQINKGIRKSMQSHKGSTLVKTEIIYQKNVYASVAMNFT